MRFRCIMRYYHPFPDVIPHTRAGCSRVTHPSATDQTRRSSPFDLNVLCTPPAFILSQDQTLKQIVYHSSKELWNLSLSYFVLASFTFFKRVVSLWFWQILYSHLLFLLCTSIFCCSIVKFQSAHPFCVSLSIISLLSRFVNRFLKSFSNFFDSVFKVIFCCRFAATSLFYHFRFNLSIVFFDFFWFWRFFQNEQCQTCFFVHIIQFSLLNFV